jgi:predicted transcriptional regulator
MKKIMSLKEIFGAAAIASAVLATNANAAGDIDFGTMTAAVSGAALIAAIVGMGVVKLGPNFARWAINKVASFF